MLLRAITISSRARPVVGLVPRWCSRQCAAISSCAFSTNALPKSSTSIASRPRVVVVVPSSSGKTAQWQPCRHRHWHLHSATACFSSRSSSTQSSSSYEDFLSGLSPPRLKFLKILNEYKAANFERDMPARFFSKIIKAVDSNDDGVITLEEMGTLLKNIGAEDEMTAEELNEIFEELGEDDEGSGERVISVRGMEERWEPFLHDRRSDFWTMSSKKK